MPHRLLYFTALLLCLFSCVTGQSQVRKIYLHPKAPGREKLSKYVDSIRIIPLEIKDGVEVGGYYTVQVSDKYLLVIDQQNKTLLVYSKDGKFVKKINYNKLGGNFYPSYEERTNRIILFGSNKHYTLTSKDQIEVKLDWANPKNSKYFKKFSIDLSDPSFTIKKDAVNERDIQQVYHYYADYYMQGQITTSPLYKDSLDHEFKLYRNNRLVKSFFPYNRISEPRFLYTSESVTFNRTDTPYIHFLTRPYCDTVYKMVKDSLFPAYQLVLPLENSLPPSFYTTPVKNRTERENFRRNNGWMLHQIYNVYETPRFIYFGVSYLSNYDSYIYEKQTDVTYRTRNIRPDSSQYNLQLLSDFSMLKKGDRFYKPQRVSDLIAFFDNNKSVAVPKELEEFLKSKPPAASPVIVEFKFKN